MFHRTIALKLMWDQLKNSPLQKFHVADMKIYEIFQERISDGVLFANLLRIKL